MKIMGVKTCKVSTLFDVQYGNSLELIYLNKNINGINFISRTALNNGVSARVDRINNIKPYPGGCLTVALGGSIGAAFYQDTPFYTAQNIAVIHFKENISYLAKLYLCQVIKFETQNKFRAFGRELNKHIKQEEEK